MEGKGICLSREGDCLVGTFAVQWLARLQISKLASESRLDRCLMHSSEIFRESLHDQAQVRTPILRIKKNLNILLMNIWWIYLLVMCWNCMDAHLQFNESIDKFEMFSFPAEIVPKLQQPIALKMWRIFLHPNRLTLEITNKHMSFFLLKQNHKY
jgi:hypothetical protein